MAKKRVFLDEQLEHELRTVFGPKAHVYTAKDFKVTGTQDPRVIDKAVRAKCLIVTADKNFVQYYKNHPLRKGALSFFYGLIFLRHSNQLPRKEQLRRALKEVAWGETRDHDDLITVYADGHTEHERLCHPECAKEFAKSEAGA
jgi:hypothetical protein